MIDIIAPTALLSEFAGYGDRYHLCLSHKILSDDVYAEYYRRQCTNGAFTILDNSCHEFGEGNTVESLQRAVDLIEPNEVVLPDRLFFGDDTAELSEEAYNVLKTKYPTLRFVGVPQGRTLDEWLFCLNRLLEIGVDTIGVSKDYEPWPGGLPRLVELVIDNANRVRISRHQVAIEIHLLGWGRRLYDLQDIVQMFGDSVRGVDSAKPLVYASAGISLPEEITYTNCPPYPKRNGFFGLTSIDHDLAIHNINVFRRHAN